MTTTLTPSSVPPVARAALPNGRRGDHSAVLATICLALVLEATLAAALDVALAQEHSR
jgi:hypothetical protein